MDAVAEPDGAAIIRKCPPYGPGAVLRSAIDSLLVRWECFTVYATRGDLPSDNNQAERVIRPIVIGRKN